MNHNPLNVLFLFFVLMFLFAQVFAEEKLQDMSDPLAVYTQAGIGYTDKGINIKIGQSYDSGNPKMMAMNVIEIKGFLGDSIGLRDDLENSADLIRFRNFKVDTTNGRGSQIDIDYNVRSKTGSASYALLQALPKIKIFQFYPLAGLGLAYANNVNEHPTWSDANSPSGFSTPGMYALVGMYSKITITEKIWVNYNPIWLSSIAGSQSYEDNTYGLGNSSVFTHEVSLSYQINPRMNVRYFGNWSNHIDFSDGDQRIELNYQI